MLNLTDSSVVELSQTRRVLLVDDQPDSTELMAMLLANHGHEVAIAHDGESALALALQFWPQVAVLDIGLPGMDGYQVAALLRSTPQTAQCRLIALSGHCGERDRAKSELAGFEQHLAKPLSIEALLLALAPRSIIARPTTG
jgi:CheY-like chemotaxis protein